MTHMNESDVASLDGRLLLVFREVLRTGSATAAGERLHLTQSAVSHAIARLRRLHGDPLFLRRPHGLEPTARALQLAPAVDALIALAAGLHGPSPAFDPATSTRGFVVAAPEFVVALVGGPLLERWSRDAPSISIAMTQLDPAVVPDHLRTRRLDIAIRRRARDESVAGLRTELLLEDEYCAVVRRGHPTIKRTLDLDRYLAAGHVIAASASEGETGERLPPGLRVTAVVPGWLTALGIVSRSNCVATCPRRLAEQHAVALDLRTVPLPGARRPIDIELLRRQEDEPGVDWLVRELRNTVRSRATPSTH